MTFPVRPLPFLAGLSACLTTVCTVRARLPCQLPPQYFVCHGGLQHSCTVLFVSPLVFQHLPLNFLARCKLPSKLSSLLSFLFGILHCMLAALLHNLLHHFLHHLFHNASLSMLQLPLEHLHLHHGLIGLLAALLVLQHSLSHCSHPCHHGSHSTLGS